VVTIILQELVASDWGCKRGIWLPILRARSGEVIGIYGLRSDSESVTLIFLWCLLPAITVRTVPHSLIALSRMLGRLVTASFVKHPAEATFGILASGLWPGRLSLAFTRNRDTLLQWRIVPCNDVEPGRPL
jgi:hypothetical protein